MISWVTPVILMSIWAAPRSPPAGPGDLEVHVAEVILRPLDVGEDDVVVSLLDEAHGDAGDGRLDGRPRPSAQASSRTPAHRRGAVRLQRLGDEPDRVRNSSTVGIAASSARWASAPWPMSRTLRASHEARLADRVGREVVVVDVTALLLAGEVVDPLPLLHRAEREQREDLRLAPREERGAVRPGLTVTSHSTCGSPPRGGRRGAACRPRSSCGRGPCRPPRGALHELLGDRVLDRRLALGEGCPTGNGSSRSSRMRSKRRSRFARAQLLRVLLRVGELA